MYLRALLSSGKRPGAVHTLPRLRYVMPKAILAPAHIAAYAKLCGFSERQGVPITYPQLLTFPLLMAFFGSAQCPWPAMGTVHLDNRISLLQALNPGDALRIEVSTGQLIAHEKGQILTLDMRFFRVDELVWEATQSLLRIGIPNPIGPAYVSRQTTDPALARQADFVAPSDTGRRFGYISGDLNPIHVSELSARLFGFRRAIAHGMWTKARALATLMPQDAVSQAEVSAEFKTPLFLPATASIWSAPAPIGSSLRGTCFEVRDEKGEKPHLRGNFSC